jgi:hypothetical protein
MAVKFKVADIFGVQGTVVFTGQVISGVLTIGMSGMFGKYKVRVIKMESMNKEVKSIDPNSKTVGVSVSGVSPEQAGFVEEREITFGGGLATATEKKVPVAEIPIPAAA